MIFQELQDLMKLVAKEHEEFVDSVIVNFVPMKVRDVEEGLEPRFLLIDAMHFSDLREKLGDLLSQVALVLWLVRMPEIYVALV